MSDAARRFAIQRAITDAAQQLNAEQFAEFKRLCKKLVYGPAFQLLALDCRDERLRNQLLDCLAPVLTAAGLPAATLTLHTAAHAADDAPADVAALEIQLRQLAAQHPIIHCLGLRAWLDAEQRPGRWDALNIRRERIAEHVPRRLLLWLDADGIQQLLTLAPDWWAWRAGVYVFSTEPTHRKSATEGWRPQFDSGQNRPTQVQAGKRIAELRDWLQGELEPELASHLWAELGDIYRSQGWWDQALAAYLQHTLPLQKILHDIHGAAVTQGRIADIQEDRGQFDEALRIRQQEELPAYKRLGDMRSYAITQGKIADILAARGQLDEALRIRKEEELPVFESLGDFYQRAITQGKIADIFFACGQFDEALRLRQQEELPVYEKLADIRERALALGKIADILTVRGQFDEALRIRQQEELPVFERLGDVRERAVAQGKIADIFTMRGQLDEALRIRQEEELPVYVQLGDARERAVTQSKIADILVSRGLLTEALCIYQQELLSVSEQLGDARLQATIQSKIAGILAQCNQIAEALCIYQQKSLPVYERLGDKHGQAISHANIANLLWQRNAVGDRVRAAELLTQALHSCRQLQLAETAAIEDLMRKLGLPIPPL